MSDKWNGAAQVDDETREKAGEFVAALVDWGGRTATTAKRTLNIYAPALSEGRTRYRLM
jgi:hypothetical protein